ncbi:hypothetical protein ETAA8_39920 [Anatilimnocola aggregata]|uniref:Uncharacterized protein n=1 Tax=Anatilimnocola aggregata TaxID=2528021 RepID=A0A517YF80_9BACT|nr:hypothetical protein [Anatilimnocola aggregata]QDU28886.1 hypothetical protein ETAA8_39920 [Anatilimnocola aggregata]
MIKRVNFTGRRRIPRSKIDLQLFDGTPRRFSANIQFEEGVFTSDAEVVLEATSAGSSIVERIACGTVGQLQQPQLRELKHIEQENVLFTLKVIDRSEQIGRLLGVADQLRPERSGEPSSGGRRGILPIELADLGQEVWRLEFTDHDVLLQVNERLTDLKDRVRSDAMLYAIIYPDVIRRVLRAAIAENVEIDEDSDRWSVLWLRFGRDLHPLQTKPPATVDTSELIDEWIDEVATAFCNQHRLFDEYQNTLTRMTGGEP